MQHSSIPPAAMHLGYAGLIPFAALTVGAVAGVEWAANGLVFYGALILSFMGGCRWGFAAAGLGAGPEIKPLAYSVVPALYAWVSMQLPFGWACLALAIGFAALFVADRVLTQNGGAPQWWTTLRLPLSIGAGVSLLAGAAIA